MAVFDKNVVNLQTVMSRINDGRRRGRGKMSIFEYGFMQRAFLVGIIYTIVCHCKNCRMECTPAGGAGGMQQNYSSGI